MKKQRMIPGLEGEDEIPGTAARRGWLPGCCVPIWGGFVINSDFSTLPRTDPGLSDPRQCWRTLSPGLDGLLSQPPISTLHSPSVPEGSCSGDALRLLRLSRLPAWGTCSSKGEAVSPGLMPHPDPIVAASHKQGHGRKILTLLFVLPPPKARPCLQWS